MARTRRKRVDPRNPATQSLPQWRWRTLPVWLALTGGFLIGWYVAALGAEVGPKPWDWSYTTWFIVLALSSFGFSRIVTRYTMIWVARRRAKSQEKRILSRPDTRRGGPS